MATLIIGDARGVALQQQQAKSNNIIFNYTYLLEDSAEYSWFNSFAITQLPLLSSDVSSVVIMLGFNDCAYSCIWNSFNIEQIALDYSETINKAMKQYSSLNFYVCSVGPTDADCAFAEYPGGVIPKKILNDKIKEFNNKIKQKCTATFIDCHGYLNLTGFNTRDGIRYMSDECEALLAYVFNNIKASAEDKFIPRMTKPIIDPNDIESEQYWVSTSYDGLNPFPLPTNGVGDTLPNCTAYAWGRFYEILGEKPKLSLRNAEQWFLNTSDGYKRGQTPALGAVICWQKGDIGDDPDVTGTDAGHVAIVEQINDDGSIVTSESGWQSSKYWWTTIRTNSNGNWGAGSNYKFQGFIYCPAITPTASATDLDKSTVTSKNEALSRTEMEANAKYIWNYLGSKGWSLNAVAGMLGNMQHESTINPGRQQINGSGFGLVQWTPKEKLTEWLSAKGYADGDMDGQLERIIWEKDNKQQYAKNKYKYTFEEFSTSLDSPYTLACAFAFDYERSAVTIWGATSKAKAATLTEAEKEANREALRQRRGGAAEEWYKFLAPLVTVADIEKKFILDGFKVDSLDSTKVKASFLIKNGNNCQYILSNDNESNPKIVTLNVDSDENVMQVVSFECDSLTPNTSYTLSIEAAGIVGKDTRTRSISFITPQSRPESAKEISLSCADTVKSVNSVFKLNVEMPKTLGYWKKNNYGYDKLLFVNNKCEKTNVIYNLTNTISESFKIQDEFGYQCKADDIVQIGIRIWTTDDNGEKVYDTLAAKTSEPICLLNNSIQAYLNI